MVKYEAEIAQMLLGELRRALDTAKALDRARIGADLWEDRVGALVTILENEIHALPQSHADNRSKLDREVERLKRLESGGDD